jgi:hypothetical protein
MDSGPLTLQGWEGKRRKRLRLWQEKRDKARRTMDLDTGCSVPTWALATLRAFMWGQRFYPPFHVEGAPPWSCWAWHVWGLEFHP